jgi:hypothetical protein
MFGEEWEPAVGTLLDTRYGGKHGDWSGNGSVTANSKKKARFDRTEPAINRHAADQAERAGPARARRP